MDLANSLQAGIARIYSFVTLHNMYDIQLFSCEYIYICISKYLLVAPFRQKERKEINHQLISRRDIESEVRPTNTLKRKRKLEFLTLGKKGSINICRIRISTPNSRMTIVMVQTKTAVTCIVWYSNGNKCKHRKRRRE